MAVAVDSNRRPLCSYDAVVLNSRLNLSSSTDACITAELSCTYNTWWTR